MAGSRSRPWRAVAVHAASARLTGIVNAIVSPTRYADGMTDSLDRLHAAVIAARKVSPETSRTARLLRAGRGKMAKKVAEEAVEVVMAAIGDHRDAVVRESADLLYNLVVLWVSAGVRPNDVWEEMERRERLFGIAEKLAKSDQSADTQRRVLSLDGHCAQRRR